MKTGTAQCLLGTQEQHTPTGADHPFTCAVLRRPNGTKPCRRLILMSLDYLMQERIYRLSDVWRLKGDAALEHV